MKYILTKSASVFSVFCPCLKVDKWLDKNREACMCANACVSMHVCPCPSTHVQYATDMCSKINKLTSAWGWGEAWLPLVSHQTVPRRKAWLCAPRALWRTLDIHIFKGKCIKSLFALISFSYLQIQDFHNVYSAVTHGRNSNIRFAHHHSCQLRCWTVSYQWAAQNVEK